MEPLNHDNSYEEFYLHEQRLLRYISYELIIVCAIVSSSYAYIRLWYHVAVIGSAGLLVLLNLRFLIRSKNIRFCSHGLILIIFLTITCANYLVWGINPAHSYWFYIIPLLAAASLIGWTGMIIYSILAFLMILAFDTFSIPSFYSIPPQLLVTIEKTNHLFAYLITVTIVVHLMLEKKYYEKVLHAKNHLLAVEKERFRYLAEFDQLTKLPNRQYFKVHLQEMINSLGTHNCLTVFFMDLDNLKYVNDYYGHNVGDELLKQSSKRLKTCFSAADFVARLGGDEFTAIVLHDPEDKLPQLIAKKIVEKFEKPFILGTIEYYCSISMGLSNYPKDSQTVKELMIKADMAMYAAKKIKGSSFC